MFPHRQLNRDGTPVPEFTDCAGLLSEGEDDDDSLLDLMDDDGFDPEDAEDPADPKDKEADGNRRLVV